MGGTGLEAQLCGTHGLSLGFPSGVSCPCPSDSWARARVSGWSRLQSTSSCYCLSGTALCQGTWAVLTPWAVTEAGTQMALSAPQSRGVLEVGQTWWAWYGAEGIVKKGQPPWDPRPRSQATQLSLSTSECLVAGNVNRSSHCHHERAFYCY